MIGTKAVTIMGWVDWYSLGENSTGRIIDNGEFIIWTDNDNDRFRIVSDTSTAANAVNNSVVLNKKQFISVTREIDGTANFYIGDLDTAPAINGTPDQDSGVPTVGTANTILGNTAAQTQTFDGLIPKLKVVEGILSLAEITQEWSSTLQDVK